VKDTPPARLLAALEEAAAGGAPMTAGIARTVVGLFRKFAPAASEPQHLSARETEVLQHLADGYTYLNIAARLEISVETVRTYIRRIYEKLHVHTRSEAVARALRAGLLR
jgi:DNA-binding NarL/FixJ family response regulator